MSTHHDFVFWTISLKRCRSVKRRIFLQGSHVSGATMYVSYQYPWLKRPNPSPCFFQQSPYQGRVRAEVIPPWRTPEKEQLYGDGFSSYCNPFTWPNSFQDIVTVEGIHPNRAVIVLKIHPRRLALWNIIMEVWFRSFSFQNGWFVRSSR